MRKMEDDCNLLTNDNLAQVIREYEDLIPVEIALFEDNYEEDVDTLDLDDALGTASCLFTDVELDQAYFARLQAFRQLQLCDRHADVGAAAERVKQALRAYRVLKPLLQPQRLRRSEGNAMRRNVKHRELELQRKRYVEVDPRELKFLSMYNIVLLERSRFLQQLGFD